MDKKSIRIYTNLVAEGWSPANLDTGIGGSEEILILLARELANKGHEVTVYHNGTHGDYDGVSYKDHTDFKAFEHSDIFISFKNRGILDLSINSEKIIHWTTEIEPKWMNFEADRVDYIVHMSKYHESRNVGVSKAKEKSIVIGNPIDFSEMKNYKHGKKQKVALYCSSLDRGIENVLRYWNDAKQLLGINKLIITYGWDFMDKMIAGNPRMKLWKEEMNQLMSQKGIEFRGRVSRKEMTKLYSKSKYWILPLNNPDSELFCINAVKAQYLGCIPVTVKDGALQETILHNINYNKMIQGREKPELIGVQLTENEKHAEQYSLENIVEQWQKILA